jgi:pyrimidine operon attenuation protein / uracil phosphoribosyltransferase
VGISKTIGSAEIQAAIARLAAAISERHQHSSSLLLLGVANGGIELACRLGRQLAMANSRRVVHVGTLDTSFHRDDIGRHPIPDEIAPTQIPVDVHGANVILIDDVLFSGRTAKAALDELFDHGRPTKVELAVLVDRGGRRLPFAADYVGLTLAADEDQKVIVNLDPTSFKRDSIRLERRDAAVARSPR